MASKKTTGISYSLSILLHALAIALCHAFRIHKVTTKSKDWKSFVETYPERVIG